MTFFYHRNNYEFYCDLTTASFNWNVQKPLRDTLSNNFNQSQDNLIMISATVLIRTVLFYIENLNKLWDYSLRDNISPHKLTKLLRLSTNYRLTMFIAEFSSVLKHIFVPTDTRILSKRFVKFGFRYSEIRHREIRNAANNF